MTDDRTTQTYADVMGRTARVVLAQMTGGLAPSTLILALTDWWAHLATAPGKQGQLWERAIRGAERLHPGLRKPPRSPPPTVVFSLICGKRPPSPPCTTAS